MIPGSANPLLLAAAEAGAYEIERSLRFNSSDSAFCGRTFTSAGDRKEWTFSAWVKRSKSTPSAMQVLLAAGPDNNDFSFVFDTDDRLHIYDWNGAFTWQKKSAQVFRDFSAWFHILAVFDTANATAEDRVRLFVNSQRITDWNTNTNPTLDYATNEVNAAQEHRIGQSTANVSRYFNGYLADIHFIDGQALDPTSFTETDATTGQLIPKAYTGTYGTNGFHLPFSDNSTAAALGTDTSGNSNTWTVNNISVAAGSGNDSLVDTPTSYGTDTGAGGEVRGNYATWNPLINGDTAANGNLDVTNDTARGTQKLLEYDAYWEITSTGGTTTAGVVSDGGTTNTTTVADGKTYGFKLSVAGALEYINITDGGSFTSITTGLTGIQFPYASAASSTTGSLNAGQRPFAATAPSGYKALCTTNLPSTTITTSGSYTGNGVAEGPFVYLNGVPTAMTVNGNAVTFGTHADKLSNGFKIRTTSTTYNQNASTYNYSITSTGDPFKRARAQSNP